MYEGLGGLVKHLDKVAQVVPLHTLCQCQIIHSTSRRDENAGKLVSIDYFKFGRFRV